MTGKIDHTFLLFRVVQLFMRFGCNSCDKNPQVFYIDGTLFHGCDRSRSSTDFWKGRRPSRSRKGGARISHTTRPLRLRSRPHSEVHDNKGWTRKQGCGGGQRVAGPTRGKQTCRKHLFLPVHVIGILSYIFRKRLRLVLYTRTPPLRFFKTPVKCCAGRCASGS